MRFSAKYFWLSVSVLLISAVLTNAQSRHSARNNDTADGAIISVTAWRSGENKEPIKVENLFLYENGIEQKIKNFSYDPSPARIVLLVDNSQTIRADAEKLKQAAME